MAEARKPKTKHPGRVSQGLTEEAQLVRGPAELIQGMRELAQSRGQVAAHVWRQAAEQYLARERKR